MRTEILRADSGDLLKICERAAAVWEAGGLVAFPTETVYGLGADGLSETAASRIYAAKNRPSDNPLILHIGRKEDLAPLVRVVPGSAEKLMDAFWPGPLTMVLPKADIVPFETTGGLSTVAVRMPSHPVANALLKSTRVPIAAPSANLSGRPSPTRAAHVIEDMDGRIDLIVDGGDVGIGLESTIVDLSGETPVLLRPGYIPREMLSEVLGEVLMDPAVTKDAIIHRVEVSGTPKAPGMKYRHYAPKAPLTVVYGDPVRTAERISSLADERTAVIAPEEHIHLYTRGHVLPMGRLSDPESVARDLYDVLRTCDAINASRIYAEDFTEADMGGAVMNRLLKAAGGNYVSEEELNRGGCGK